MASKINSLVVKLINAPELGEAGSEELALDKTKVCVRIFDAMGCNITINDIDIAHRVPPRSA